jgi:hypothetical protein
LLHHTDPNGCLHPAGVALVTWLALGSTNLTTLDVSRCQLSEQGIGHLARLLACSTSLQTLDMSENSVGEWAAEKMSGALRVNSTLRHLNMAWCGFNASCVPALIDALMVSGVLHLRCGCGAVQQAGLLLVCCTSSGPRTACLQLVMQGTCT